MRIVQVLFQINIVMAQVRLPVLVLVAPHGQGRKQSVVWEQEKRVLQYFLQNFANILQLMGVNNIVITQLLLLNVQVIVLIRIVAKVVTLLLAIVQELLEQARRVGLEIDTRRVVL